ncbi:MAG: hypothetical protein PVI71_12510 [Desulfobacterales bacterium]
MLNINLFKISGYAIRKFSFIFVILFTLALTSPVWGVEILFITGTRLYQSDSAILNNLESRGSVTVIQDREAQYTDALDKDMVVISESVYSRKLNTTFRNLPIPVIVSEPWLFNDMGMTGSNNAIDFGRAPKQSSLIINDLNHDLTAGLAGKVSISRRKRTLGWGMPGKGALRIATLDNDSTKCTVFAYEKGVQMPGLKAPAKRLGFFLYRNTASFLTSEGWALFNAAVEWALTPDHMEPLIINVVSDASWKAKTEPGIPLDLWYRRDYVDAHWVNAYAPFPEPDFSKVPTTDASFIWYWPFEFVQPTENYYGAPEAWFRKTFEIPADPSNFRILDSAFASGGPVDFYINGTRILDNTYTIKKALPRWLDMGPHLVEGKNVIAIYSHAAESEVLEERHRGVWLNLTLEASTEENQDSPVKKALLVVGRMPVRCNDRALKMRLERLGFLVRLVDDETIEKADADDMDLIIISETVWSKLIGDLFTAVEVPVICLESYLYDDLYMSGAIRNIDYGNSPRRQIIDVVSPDHPLSAGMSEITKVTTRRRHIGWSLPAESAIIIASLVDDPERAVIFAYNNGAPMARNYPAPAKRIGMFLHGNSASRLTAAGWDLFDAAVIWAIDKQN